MIKTTTHNDDLLKNQSENVFVNQTNEEILENIELIELEEKIKNIRFSPNQSSLDYILTYASR